MDELHHPDDALDYAPHSAAATARAGLLALHYRRARPRPCRRRSRATSDQCPLGPPLGLWARSGPRLVIRASFMPLA